MCVHGPTGVSVCGSTPLAKMSFGPCPSKCAAIGAPTNDRDEQEDDEADAGQRKAVAPEPDPDQLPVPARLDAVTTAASSGSNAAPWSPARSSVVEVSVLTIGAEQ